MATEKVRQQAIDYGLPAENVHISGIPIAPAFPKESRSKEALRRELGWRTDLPAALAVGSVRVLHMAEILRQLNSAGLPLQLAIVAGGDAGLLNELSANRLAAAHSHLRLGGGSARHDARCRLYDIKGRGA